MASTNPEREGYLQTHYSLKKKKNAAKKKWKFYWFCLVQGTLFVYKHAHDVDPVASLLLQDYTLEKKTTLSVMEPPTHFHFNLHKDSESIPLVAESEEELKGWIDTLENSYFLIGIGGLDPAAAPPHKVKPKKESMLLRAKKNVAGKAATSALGNKVILDKLPPELSEAITLFASAIEKRDGRAKSVEIHKTLTKLVLKSWLQIDQKTLKEEDFYPITSDLGETFELLVRFNDEYKSVSEEVAKKIFARSSALIKSAGHKLVTLLTPHLKPENVHKFSNCFAFLSDPNFLPELWSSQSIRENELYRLCNVYKKCAPRDVRKKRKVHREFFPKTLKTPR
eukprot:TRINITY_DN1531_c0_g1_i3.p1 TRINITY_DN1531_c0_g1~~TRINITY_DN1531_c0_g1_i3.p1  ORF type:complete len:364 (-),score=83.68 TRINITY_DN1531_c0_g1_i3:265-1278(-)